MKDFFVIVTGYTGTGDPKYLTAAGDWTSSLQTAKRISDFEEAQKQMLAAAFSRIAGSGNEYKIEKVIEA